MDKKSDWPSPDEQRLNEATGEYYFTPDFTKEVDHEENEIIHRRVAKIVYESLQVSIDWDTEGDLYTKLLTQDASTAPSEVKDTRFFWNAYIAHDFISRKVLSSSPYQVFVCPALAYATIVGSSTIGFCL